MQDYYIFLEFSLKMRENSHSNKQYIINLASKCFNCHTVLCMIFLFQFALLIKISSISPSIVDSVLFGYISFKNIYTLGYFSMIWFNYHNILLYGQ